MLFYLRNLSWKVGIGNNANILRVFTIQHSSQHYPIELSVMMEMIYKSAFPVIIAMSNIWLLSF